MLVWILFVTIYLRNTLKVHRSGSKKYTRKEYEQWNRLENEYIFTK